MGIICQHSRYVDNHAKWSVANVVALRIANSMDFFRWKNESHLPKQNNILSLYIQKISKNSMKIVVI